MEKSPKPQSNPLIHFGIIVLIFAVGLLTLIVCVAMMTPQGGRMMGMQMSTEK